MSVEIAVADLTLQTTNLLGTIATQRDTLAGDISAAVEASENATQIPLAIVATNLLNTQTLLVTLLNGS